MNDHVEKVDKLSKSLSRANVLASVLVTELVDISVGDEMDRATLEKITTIAELVREQTAVTDA